ncbi:hypothetical protein GIB67_012611 [Kingdonia uniflora]|uniref:Uncharacterized protein n=1 Tax=Kingdonia uniflora TaxID=39325 RepID=A0A7J7NFA5_9MAGN|nr:hypothetical protein GIB67_012611 [Kingdonia uniflora]
MMNFVSCRGWIGQVLAFLVFFIAVFMLLTRWCNQGMPVDRIKVTAPPAMNAMEQLLVLQNTLSQVEELVQEGTVSLLKLRALLLSVFPQASEKLALALLLASLVLAFIPSKYIFLLTFLYTFTGNSPLMKTSTSRWIRRLREWWFSIPAAPAVLEKPSDHRKRK